MKLFKKLFRKKNKKEKKELSDMSKKEKKEFLSMDLIERLIRVEQRVASSFNEHVPYNKTEYYKSLEEQEKKKFDKYLKRKTAKKSLVILFLLLVLVSPVFLKIGFSGFAVRENLQETFSLLENGLILFSLGFVCILFVLFVLNKAKKRKFEKYFDIIDRVAVKNYMAK